MSDNVQPTADSPVPPVVYEVSEFSEGDAKGFKYTHPEYATAADAEAVYGKDVVANLVNVAIQGRIRTKVKNDLGLSKMKPIEVQPFLQKKLTATGGILFTETDAKEWRPDVRELSPKQLFKQANALLKEGKVTEAMAAFAKMQRLMFEMTQLEAGVTAAEPA